MLTIALIDKFPILRKGLSLYLEEHYEGVTVLSCESAEIFSTQYPGQNPDLVILGINQHPSSGETENIGTVKKWNVNGKVIVYDEKADPTMIADYLKAEVNGYVSKQNPISELDECIQAVLKGKRYICPQVLDSVSDKSLVKRNASPEDSTP
ncbi:response regulator [Dyadobacter psychrotolerans]|uniref:Response regulator transcription factor n=1 Tax=Dyadobacter psychrotolerans TaxID=2541721 RepID=A0A4R5DCR2_9BACT|nr:response regulator [Dyadobacter psychrotolerans]TDE11546.1 response regulator transcription factor [Dyadobacter psychrotolerans]